MQTIKVAKVESWEGDSAKGHWQNYIITGEDNTKVSTFDKAAANLKEGDIIEAEIEVKGKYANLKMFKVIDHGPALPKAEPEPPDRDTRAGSIEQQVAAKIVAELRIANALTDTSPEYEALLAWCRERLGIGGKSKPEGKKELKKEPVPAKTDVPCPSPVDMEWLNAQMEILQAKNIKGWEYANVLSYLNTVTGSKSKSISEVVRHLKQEQAADFVNKIKEAMTGLPTEK